MVTERGMETMFIEKNLGDCLELVIDHRGKTPKKLGADWVPSGIPTISAKNVNGGRLIATDDIRYVSHDIYRRWMKEDVKRGDCFLVSEGATLGECMMWDYDYPVVLGQRIFCLRADPTVLYPRYLYAYMTSESFQSEIIGRATGTSVDGLRQTEVLKLKLRLPPLAQQRHIGDTLYNLDKKIDLNRRMNATLEGMARALFQSWFVDFDPVRAKLDGRKPEGMDKATAAFFPEQFAHGKHDMLPVGWNYSTIEEVCAINAWTLGKTDCLETLEYIEISEVSHGNIGNIATYSRGEEPSRARRRLRHGDTIVSTVRPDRGSYFLALNPPDNRVASTGFAVLTPSKVPWSFIHAALTQPEVFDHLGQMADGGAYPAVRPEIIGAMQIAVPNDQKILETFHRTCAPLFEEAEANRIQSRTLANLRDTLLPKLLSGELSVAGATHTAGNNP